MKPYFPGQNCAFSVFLYFHFKREICQIHNAFPVFELKKAPKIWKFLIPSAWCFLFFQHINCQSNPIRKEHQVLSACQRQCMKYLKQPNNHQAKKIIINNTMYRSKNNDSVHVQCFSLTVSDFDCPSTGFCWLSCINCHLLTSNTFYWLLMIRMAVSVLVWWFQMYRNFSLTVNKTFQMYCNFPLIVNKTFQM